MFGKKRFCSMFFFDSRFMEISRFNNFWFGKEKNRRPELQGHNKIDLTSSCLFLDSCVFNHFFSVWYLYFCTYKTLAQKKT